MWVGAEDRSVRFSTLSMGMGTNTALPIFAYYTKFINADPSLSVSQEDFKAPETIFKSPIDCVLNSEESQQSNQNFEDIWGDNEDQW